MEAPAPEKIECAEATTEDRYVEASRSLLGISVQLWQNSGAVGMLWKLATQAQLLDQRAVAIDVGAGHVVEQTPATADEQ